jgi:hypothetical protein
MEQEQIQNTRDDSQENVLQEFADGFLFVGFLVAIISFISAFFTDKADYRGDAYMIEVFCRLFVYPVVAILLGFFNKALYSVICNISNNIKEIVNK